jgi:hypothetical protein
VRRLRTARVLVASASLVLIGLSAPAAMATTGEHCVADLVPNAADVAEYQCFDTFADAIAHATDGKVQLPANAVTVSDEQLTEAGVTSSSDVSAVVSTVLGTEYDGTSYGGGTLTLTGSGGCDGTRFGFPNLSDYGWNNKPSSAKAYGGCWSDHYDDPSYGDPMFRCTGNCPGLGGLNNKTSSIRVW